MYEGKGGSIPEHDFEFSRLAETGASVEMRGGCYSACTLLTVLLPKERLCFAEGAFLAFHAAWNDLKKHKLRRHLDHVSTYPIEIRQWIDRHGGLTSSRSEYWTMYDRDLWAMGYPKCK